MTEPAVTHYLYKIQPTRPEMLTTGTTPEEETMIEEHFNYLQRLTEARIVLLAGRTLTTDYSCFGIVLFMAQSEEEARCIMHDDPAVKARVMRAELYPFSIALMANMPKVN